MAALLHFHHLVKAANLDYIGVAVAAFASWAGVPGPGEPVLIAAGIFAARHKLDISGVLFVAWAGATVGGIVGWVVGLKFGRTLLTAKGPLRSMRRRAVERGEEVFGRVALLAILVTPAWVAGIYYPRVIAYNVINVVTAAIWAAAIGLGAYYVGPPVIDAVGDAGTVAAIVLIVLAVVLIVVGMRRRRRGRQRRRRSSV
jgi:membrane protein DedA with SNARE-associated domain